MHIKANLLVQVRRGKQSCQRRKFSLVCEVHLVGEEKKALGERAIFFTIYKHAHGNLYKHAYGNFPTSLLLFRETLKLLYHLDS